VATIVVVEDQPDNLKLVTTLLRLKGHEVVAFDRGEGVAEAVRAHRPALVLCDLQLPGRDGFAVLQDLQAIEGDHPKVVALTAHAMPGDREKAIAAGFDGYITKPIDVRTFPDQVAALLG
jgi:CheY-like chemotaxis protein